MTPLEKFIDESQRVCDAVGNPTVADLMTRTHQANESDAEHLYVLTAVARFPQALQHLRELSQQNEALTRRVAELEGQVRCGWGGGPKP